MRREADPTQNTNLPASTSSAQPYAWAKRGLLLVLLGYLLFSHGCHGNEDNELWAKLVNWVWTGAD